ncbi:MAG: hypothetical protein Q4G43_17125 [Mobilicoccus sp.]|nr:hypothetical protein [Mobilicoccus sp.]
MNRQLDSFQTELLDDLRSRIEERADSTDSTGGRPVDRPRRLSRPLVAAAIAGLAVVGSTLAVLTATPEPAYAVGTGPGDRVTVQVNRLEDAAGLERELAALGVMAHIEYRPDGTLCAPGRAALAAEGVGPQVTEFGFGDDGVHITFERGQADSEAMILLTATRSGDLTAAQFDVVTGPIAPCTPVPAA